MEPIRQVEKFFEIFEHIQRIVDSPIEWSTKYDLVFSEAVSESIKETGIRIDWSDPDMDYEDDVRAYFGALEEKANELKHLL